MQLVLVRQGLAPAALSRCHTCCCCRLESVRLVLVQAGSLDEMLDAEEQLSEQLESLPYLVRFQYDKSRCAKLYGFWICCNVQCRDGQSGSALACVVYDLAAAHMYIGHPLWLGMDVGTAVYASQLTAVAGALLSCAERWRLELQWSCSTCLLFLNMHCRVLHTSW